MTIFEGRNRVTSPYGWRYLNNVLQWHNGFDSVGDDSWDMRSIWDGIVETVAYGVNGGRGNYIIVRYNDTLRYLYQHMDKIYVKKDDVVKQGQVVGVMGNTPGEPYSYGAHSHAEAHEYYNGKWNVVNPEKYFEVPNEIGTYQGNNNIDGGISPTPYKPVAGTAILKIGAMSQGDMDSMKALAQKLAVGNAQDGEYLLCGPMTSGDQASFKARAGELKVPCEEYKGEVTLAIGAMSEGDLHTITAKAKELSLDYSTADYRENEFMLYAPVSYGDRLEMEKLAYSLLLPVGLA